MYNALVIDDEADARNVMRKLLELFCPEISLMLEAEDGEEALKMVSSRKFDFAFVDIQLNGESGIDVAKQISRYCPNIIFVTAYDKYAVEAFQTEAIHYLLKPVDPELLQQAIRRSNLQFDAPSEFDNRIFLTTKEKMIVLHHDEIRYMAGDRNYTTFYYGKENVLVSRNLAHYERLLDSPSFYRIHQSYLVNSKYVAGVRARDQQGNYCVILRNGDEIPLARSRRKAFVSHMGWK
ncbi:response regulator transcription factor [Neolewinella aurantiaca]|uniref:Response regulator transcription factor n=1 Tax=Neolewinella aurantiaca TaxID=2602767 RepID=A0A5C7FQ61_9BACT|nr:LytTR family DNA-binding domain-containing protein [Neolewinella aurantiaca]TXF88130.1 response regulator transcription factor [Neolewinella aurantiaca]